MDFYFYRYFFAYIFKSKTRQRLLFIAITGLFLSSFSLLVVQSIMGGLQSGLLARSQQVLGHGHMNLSDPLDRGQYDEIFTRLRDHEVVFYPEYEIELMARHERQIAPLILHGVDYSWGVPSFLSHKDRSAIVLSSDLATSLAAYYGARLQIFSPSHQDRLFGDVVRFISDEVSDFSVSELSEIDSVHAWTRASSVQNLIRQKSYNKVRFYGQENFAKAQDVYPQGEFVSWEEQNQSLVWALKLETSVMFFLFASMTLLVALCITSGFLIFYDKIKLDLMSFWVLGKSRGQVLKLIFIFTQVLSLGTCLLGVSSAFLLLSFFVKADISIMPSFFVERTIPVRFDLYEILLALFVPYIIACVFSWFSFRFFQKENASFLANIRKIV